MALSRKEIKLIQEALNLLNEAEIDEARRGRKTARKPRSTTSAPKTTTEKSETGGNTKLGATGEFKIAAYCAGCAPIVDKRSYDVAVRTIGSMSGASKVLSNATNSLAEIGSKQGGFMYWEDGTTDTQAKPAGYKAAGLKSKIAGVEKDAQDVAEMIKAWRDPKSGDIPVADMYLDVTADDSQGDIFVNKPGNKKKFFAWSLKVQGSEAGQLNLGSSELITELGYDYKVTIIAALTAFFQSKNKNVTGLAKSCPIKRGVKKATGLDFELNAKNQVSKIDRDFYDANKLTTLLGKALAKGLVENCLSLNGFNTFLKKITDRNGVGTVKADETLIGSPKAAKSWKKSKKFQNTNDLFPGLNNLVKNKTKIVDNKILLYKDGNTIHVGYGTSADVDSKATGRCWRMSLRKSNPTGGATANIKFDAKPPTLSGTMKYKNKQKFLADLLKESSRDGFLKRLLKETEENWQEYDLDPNAPEEPMSDDTVDITDPDQVADYFLGADDIEEVLVMDEEEYDPTPEEIAQVCSLVQNECHPELEPQGEMSDPSVMDQQPPFQQDTLSHRGMDVHSKMSPASVDPEMMHVGDEEDEINESRWLKLAGILKD